MPDRLRMSLSLDLDNKWAYLKTHGSNAWQDFPSYLDTAVPRILEFLQKREVKITFFIVGQDAALEQNHQALQLIPAAGHDIASHSFNHDPWLHLYNESELEADLERAENAIEAATSARVRGFRGPGFSLSTMTLDILARRGYAYDATAFPNILNPLARLYFFSRSRLTREQKKQRGALFGSYTDAFRPVKPYRWELQQSELLELPVTTMPLFKIPIHFSYLVYLASFSPRVARLYLHSAIKLCRLHRTEPSLLLHPLDFLGEDDDRDLAFFPAMNMTAAKKLAIMQTLFEILQDNFQPCTVEEYVASIESSTLKRYTPDFSHRSLH